MYLPIQALPEPNYVHAVIKWNEQMVYHQFVVEKSDSAVNVEITPTDPEVELLVFVKHRVKPLLHSYDLMINLANIREENGNYILNYLHLNKSSTNMLYFNKIL